MQIPTRLAGMAAAFTLAVTPAAALADHHMKAKGNIVAAVVASKDHQTLETAVKSAKLVDTLAKGGPFTLFAPTDSAFAKLPAGTVDTLLKPENRDQLQAILTYHVVPGKVKAAQLIQAIDDGGGKAMLTTVQGAKLTASLDGGKVVLTDAKGGTATVTATDMKQSNGIIHVIDSVVLPM